MFRYYYKFAQMAPSTGRWKVMMTSLNIKENMEILKNAKERQNSRPRDLEIIFDISCCSHLKENWFNEGEDEFLEQKKTLFRDWAEYITSLKVEILGNEMFLLNKWDCPNIEPVFFLIFPNRRNHSITIPPANIIIEFIWKHAQGLKCLEILGDFQHPTFMIKFPSHMPSLEHGSVIFDIISLYINSLHIKRLI